MSAQSLEDFRAFRQQQEARRHRPSLPRRARALVATLRRRRGAAYVALVVALVLTGTVAVAAWLSSGVGVGAATATTVNKASAPTVTRAGSAATVTWNAVTLASGVPVSGYRVLRHVGSTVTIVCTSSEPTRTCDDNAPVGGTAQYGVVALRGGWSGPESDLTSYVGDATAPTTSIARTPAPNAAGWNKTDVQVTLTATDAGSGVKEIHYTVNGVETVVVASGASAQTSFTVSREDANAVTFWSVDNVGNAGAASSTELVKVDKTAPVTAAAVTSAGALVNGWYTKPASVALSATDSSPFTGAAASGVTSTQYQLGNLGGTWQTYSGALTANDGTTTVYFQSSDLADNTEGTKTQVVKVDSVGPVLGAASPAGGTQGSNDWYVGAVAPVVKLTATDATSGVAALAYRVDTTGPWTPYDAAAGISVPESTSSAGTELYFRATDTAGNITTSDAAYVVKYDRTAPSAPTATVNPSLNDGSNGYYVNAPKVTGSASTDAASGVDHYEYQVNGGAWAKLSPSSDAFTVPDGKNQAVGVRAVDKAGNTSTAVLGASLKVDTTRPTAAATVTNGTLGQDGYYTSSPTVRFTGTDAVELSKVEYSTTGGAPWTDITTNSTVVLSAQGTTTYAVRATDAAGNTATSQLVVKVDTNAPSAGTATVTPTTPNGLNGWYSSEPTVVLSGGIDPAGGSGYAGTQYQFDNNTWGAFYTGQITVKDTPQQGTTLFWRGLDNAGNPSAVSNRVLKVDTTKPSTTAQVTAGTAGSSGWYTSGVDVKLSPSDVSSGVGELRWQVTGSNVAPASWATAASASGATTITVPKPEGTSWLWYRTLDVAGNTDVSSFPLLIDLAKPFVGSTWPGSTYAKNSTWVSGSTTKGGTCDSGIVCADVGDTGSGVASVSYTLTTSTQCYVGTNQTYASTSPLCVVPMARTSGTTQDGTWKSSTPVNPPSGEKKSALVTIIVTDAAGQVSSTSYTVSSST